MYRSFSKAYASGLGSPSYENNSSRMLILRRKGPLQPLDTQDLTILLRTMTSNSQGCSKSIDRGLDFHHCRPQEACSYLAALRFCHAFLLLGLLVGGLSLFLFYYRTRLEWSA